MKRVTQNGDNIIIVDKGGNKSVKLKKRGKKVCLAIPQKSKSFSMLGSAEQQLFDRNKLIYNW